MLNDLGHEIVLKPLSNYNWIKPEKCDGPIVNLDLSMVEDKLVIYIVGGITIKQKIKNKKNDKNF